jgi:hypothetical protein
MAEEGKRDAPIPAPGDGAGRTEGGAAPGSQSRETASGRIEERGAAEAAERGWEMGLMMDMDPEVEAMVEKAMDYLRQHLNKAELREYEKYYEEYKRLSGGLYRYDYAHKILRRFVAEIPHEEAYWYAARFIPKHEVRLLSIHIDYIYSLDKDAVIRTAEIPGDVEDMVPDAIILRMPETVSEAYEAVAQDIRDITKHILERIKRLSQLTDELLRTLEEREELTKYPNALEGEEPREEKSEGKEAG